MNNCICNNDVTCFKCASGVDLSKGNETVTHLGGPRTSACTDIEPQDMFTHLKASVDCDSCLSDIELRGRDLRRFQVDFDDSHGSWGVKDTHSGKFVGHTTTTHGARVMRRNMERNA